MIIKNMDSKQEDLAELTALLKGRLTSYQQLMIERELKAIKSGVEGETNPIAECRLRNAERRVRGR